MSERLQQKLARMGYEEVSIPERLHKSGYTEAWSWQAKLSDGSEIGCDLSMTECVAMLDSELEKFLD